jgi:hypothetical protein
VNPNLSDAELDALLEVLHHGLIFIRLAAFGGDAPRAEAIADALHNLPRLLSEGHRWGSTTIEFRRLFLDALVERYPELALLEQPLDALR